MNETVLKTEEVVVVRQEASFDRACDEGYSRAVTMLGVDDDGHAKRVKGWERSSCFVRVVFESYTHTGSMGGHEHVYVFRAEAVKGANDE